MSKQLTKSQSRLESVLTSTDSVITKINTGQGTVGLLVNDPRFGNRPMVLETPKEQLDGCDMDAQNLNLLRGLIH